MKITFIKTISEGWDSVKRQPERKIGGEAVPEASSIRKILVYNVFG